MQFNTAAALKQKLIYPKVYDPLLTGNQTVGVWSFGSTDAPQVQVNRLYSVGTVSPVDCSTVISTTDVSAAGVTFDFSTYQATYPLCYNVKAGANAGGTQEELIMSAAMKAASEQLEILIAVGDGGNFLGLDDLVETSFAASVSGGAIEDIWQLFDSVKASGPNMVMVATEATRRKLVSIVKNDAFTGYDQLNNMWNGTPTVNGVPVIANSNVAAGHIYLAQLGGDGLDVVFNEVAGAKIGGLFDWQYIAPSATTINEHYRVIYRATQVLRNPKALARVTGII
jgi:hypothetical protein